MTTTLFVTIPLLCSLLCAAAPPQESEEPSTTIKLDVNLVVINLTVTNKNGTVAGLGKQAFTLYVDDQPLPISMFHGEDAPVTVGIVVDNSASMGPKRSEVIAAATAFAKSSNPHDQMFVVHFSDHPRFGLPVEKPFSDNIQDLEKALARFTVSGTTAIYDAMGFALSQMDRAVINRKVLIMISDGGDNSSKARLADVMLLAQKSGVVFYCIGLFDDLDRDQNPRLLTQFAQATGGKAYFPADVKDTTAICLEIAREIRSQYTIGFAGAEDGKYHHIKVTALEPKYGELKVSTRPGYLAAKQSQ